MCECVCVCVGVVYVWVLCMCGCVRVCVYGCACLCGCVCAACFKMLKGIHARTHTHQLCDEHNAHCYCLSTLFFVWRLVSYSGHGLPLFVVSIQLKFYEIGLSVLRPTPSNPGRPIGCFLVWFLTKLPGMGDPAVATLPPI